MHPNMAGFIALVAGETPVMTGQPGVSKTAWARAVAAVAGRHLCILEAADRPAHELCGVPRLVSGTRSYFHTVPPEWFVKIHERHEAGQASLLVLDDISHLDPDTFAAAMSLLHPDERRLGENKLPEDCWVIAFRNPESMATKYTPLPPAVSNRVVQLPWTPDRKSFLAGLRAGLEFPAPELPEHEPGLLKSRRRHWGETVADFLDVTPSAMLLAEGRKYSDEYLTGPFESFRSWTSCVRLLAAADAFSAPVGIRNALMDASVGPGPAGEFRAWLRTNELPDVEQLLQAAMAGATESPWTPDATRPDRTLRVIEAIIRAVMGDLDNERTYTSARVEGVWKALLWFVKDHREAVFSCLVKINGPVMQRPPADSQARTAGQEARPKIPADLVRFVQEVNQAQIAGHARDSQMVSAS